MTIWVFPKTGAYNGELYDAVSKLNIETLESDLGFNWLLKKGKKGDILHLHWPSYRYLRNGSIFAIGFAFVKFCLFILLIEAKGIRLWWTAHNLMPHEECRIRPIDAWARRITIRFCEKIFVHGKSAQKILSARFPSASKKMISIPHGHWIGYYGDIKPKNLARKKLKIPEKCEVFLMFGQLKPYKNLEGLISAFQQLPTSDNYLVIAGKFSDALYQQKIEDLIAKAKNIKLDARFIDDSEVAYYLAASDVMCMPYNEILTSGTAILSMSYGRPVISLNKGYLVDVVDNNSGILIDKIDVLSLKNAMIEITRHNWDEKTIIEHVAQFTFDDAARIFAQEIESHNIYSNAG